MANSTSSNITAKIMRAFIPAMERQRVLSKAVDTQLFAGQFTPQFGTTVDIKRPHQYRSIETSTGDISTAGTNAITAGKATATVQSYITVAVDWTNKEEATSLDQLTEILAPAAEECVTKLETNLSDYMIKNSGLVYGTVGTAIDAWSDIAGQMSFMKSIGVPMGDVYSVVNPFIIQNLAGAQYGLTPGGGNLVQTAWEKAQISNNLGGIQMLSSNALTSWTSGTESDRVGSLASVPDITYATHKDTMKQTISVENLSTTGLTIKAGDMVEYGDVYYINQKTRQPVFNAAGAKMKFRAVVTSDTTVSTAGASTISVSGPMIFETNGQYNTVDAAPTTSTTVTVLGSAGTTYQPSLFFHKKAFSVAFVKLPKLYSTDTVAWTKDGISMRVSKYSDGDANTQKMRIDLLPAFGVMNPFFAGKGFGL